MKQIRENDRRENEPREFNTTKRDLPYENWEKLYGTNVNRLEMYLIHMSITKMLIQMVIFIIASFYSFPIIFGCLRFTNFVFFS